MGPGGLFHHGHSWKGDCLDLIHSYLPISSALFHMARVALIACTLASYERDAPIMFTISSITLMFGILTNPFLSASGWRGSYITCPGLVSSFTRSTLTPSRA